MKLSGYFLSLAMLSPAVHASAAKIAKEIDAIAVAEPALVAKFGKDEIAGQRPFRVRIVREEGKDAIWIVEGAMRRGPKGVVVFGGVVCVHIREADGKIIELFMWK
jgi:hypothetical protein